MHLVKLINTMMIICRIAKAPQILRPRIQCNIISTNITKLTSTLLPSSLSTKKRSLLESGIVGSGVVVVRVSMMSSGTHDGRFALSETSTLILKKGNITQWFVDGSSDAIVNPANERMLGGGGADGAIHRAAGPELREACYKVPEVRPGVRCPTGEARITPGFKLPASYVIHTVGPIYDMDSNPQASLRSAYENSLKVAKEKNIQYIAFTAISCGVYGYPFEEAATIAISTIKEFANYFKEVHFVLFSDEIYNVWLVKAKEMLQT
ncbi:Macro domain-containing protein [Cephalotus follicularis]|uniref:Macro domain-containing protein n=1 Tax=Cephalotus follicularis TaxID=3775 RepID=A0A1Q3B395_CEPFO|nr:Macro domain-containing protein [Cephalotus follicularis]